MTALARTAPAPEKPSSGERLTPLRKRRAVRCWGCSELMVSDCASVICAGCRANPPAWMCATAAEAAELGEVS